MMAQVPLQNCVRPQAACEILQRYQSPNDLHASVVDACELLCISVNKVHVEQS